MDETTETVAVSPRRRTTSAVALVGAGLVGGIVLAGLSVASADSRQAPTPTPSVGPDERPAGKPFGKRGHRGLKHGFGPDALHGEFTTKDPDGEGYKTFATQRGEATAVSATSITVRSEDGFSRTYVVSDGTMVNAGDEGIADVAAGDQVHVIAVVVGDTANAIRVADVTNLDEWKQRWRPRRDQRGVKPAPSGRPS